MTTRPTTLPDWATDTNYASGPANGTATKVVPNAGLIAQGYKPADEPGAQNFNWQLNLLGQWIAWVDSAKILVATQIINASGTYTPTAGTKRVRLRMVGGGGGSGSAVSTAGNSAGSGGGASGQYLEVWLDPAGLITGGAVTIGAGGTAGTTAGGLPTAGGDTTIVINGTTFTAKKGDKSDNVSGVAGNRKWPGGSIFAGSGANASGTFASIPCILAGEHGGIAIKVAQTPSSDDVAFGDGGGSPLGQGGAGEWTIEAIGYGAGGRGVPSINGASNNNGKVGLAGVVIIEEYA